MQVSSISWCLGCAVLAVAGCSRQPGRIYPPDVDAGASAAAIEAYDTSGDGLLDENELEKSPPLRAAITRIDKNGDRKIEAEEIDARISAWRESKVGIMPVTVRLKVNSQPVVGAAVTMVPEAFLGEAIKPAQGTTNRHGVAVMRISDVPEERGVQSGFYRVLVSTKSTGTEKIPSRYNSETEIGLEVEPMSPASRDVSFNLAL